MLFKNLSEYFSKLETTTLRLEMTKILAQLFKEADASEIGNLCYLLQGRVAPLYQAIEFGMADRMIIRAIAQGLDIDVREVTKVFKKEGDLGVATAKLKVQSSKFKTAAKNLKLNEVFEILYQIATAGGEGSQEEKIKLLSGLIHDVDSLSARYLVRIPLNKLRLGFSDMTILDSLSWMLKGSKQLRGEIERAYNVRPDLGFISQTLKEKGIAGLAKVTPVVGAPILMAKAERMTCGKDIIDKVGKCAVEPKWDGLRVQAHIKKLKTQNSNVKTTRLADSPRFEVEAGASAKRATQSSKRKEFEIKLFSRNLEDVTGMYPDIVDGIKKQIKAHEAILEGEAVAYNPKTGEYLPFQETVQRKRKYNIEAKAKEIPLRLIVFDLLYLDGESLLNSPYQQRRQRLEKIII